VLRAFVEWSKGEQSPALGDGLPGGRRALATRFWDSVYSALIADRPLIERAMAHNLLSNPHLNRYFSDDERALIRSMLDGTLSSRNDARAAIKQIIRKATEDELYLQLAAAILAPMLEAACAGAMQAAETNPGEHFYERVLSARQKNAQLKHEARLDPQRHVGKAFTSLDAEGREKEMLLSQIAVRAAADQLTVDRDDRQQPIVVPAQEVRERTADAATLQSMLNRVAPRQGRLANVRSTTLPSDMPSNTLAAIHKAIADTIAGVVIQLPRYSDYLARLSAIAPPHGESRSTSPPFAAADPEACILPFLAPGAAQLFALQQRPGSREAEVVLMQSTACSSMRASLYAVERSEASSSASITAHDETTSPPTWKQARSALLHRDFKVRNPEDRSEKLALTCAPMEDALDIFGEWTQGAQSLATGQFVSAFDKFIAPHPAIASQVATNLRADAEIKACLSSDPELKPFFEANGNVASELVRKVIDKATAAKCYAPLAAAIYAPLTEALCVSQLLPGGLDDRDVKLKHSHEKRRLLAQLIADEQMSPAGVAGATPGWLKHTNRAPRLSPDAVNHAERTAKLQSMLNRVGSSRGGAPYALLAGADADTISAAQEAAAMTIANTVNELLGVSGITTRNVPEHRVDLLRDALPDQATSSNAMPTGDTLAPGQSRLRFWVPGGTFSYALELQRGGQSVAVLRKQWVDFSRIPTVLNAWEDWNRSALALADGSANIDRQHAMSVLESFVLGRPSLEKEILTKLRATPSVSGFFQDFQDDVPSRDMASWESSPQRRVRVIENAPSAAGRTLERGVPMAIENRRQIELASVMYRTVIETACAAAAQAVDFGSIAGSRPPRGHKSTLSSDAELHAINTAEINRLLGPVAPKHVSPTSMPLEQVLQALAPETREVIRKALDEALDMTLADTMTQVLIR
jgi:hypothetical protein